VKIWGFETAFLRQRSLNPPSIERNFYVIPEYMKVNESDLIPGPEPIDGAVVLTNGSEPGSAISSCRF